ncbi:hypothetical protein ES705_10627 [subsurface metagenome]
MGLFGGSSKKTYTTSTTNLTQEDKSVKVGGDAEIVLGAEAKLSVAEPGGVVLDAPDTSGGDIVFNQFPEAVAGTVSELVKSVETTTGYLGEALGRQQIGGETVLPKIVLYLTVGVGVMLIASRMFKK